MKKKTKTALTIAAVGVGILALSNRNGVFGAEEGTGSFGGSDEDVINPYAPDGNPFQNIDPNYQYPTEEEPLTQQIPTFEDPTPNYSPEQPSGSGGSSQINYTPAPADQLRAVSTSGSSSNPIQDVGILGGAFAIDAAARTGAKAAGKAVDTKFKFPDAPDSKLKKFLQDPYNLQSVKPQKAGSEIVQTGTDKLAKGAVAEVAVKAAPKWAKGLKAVANFIPIIDIPIGAALDVYLTRNEGDKAIGWGDAFAANTAGELAQLGITGGGALAGGVGAVPAWFVGATGDIAATEAYYKARGKSSLFDMGDSSNSSGGSSKAAVVSEASKVRKEANADVQSSQTTSINKLLGLDKNSLNYTPINYTPVNQISLSTNVVKKSGGSGSSKKSDPLLQKGETYTKKSGSDGVIGVYKNSGGEVTGIKINTKTYINSQKNNSSSSSSSSSKKKTASYDSKKGGVVTSDGKFYPTSNKNWTPSGYTKSSSSSSSKSSSSKKKSSSSSKKKKKTKVCKKVKRKNSKTGKTYYYTKCTYK